METNNEVIAHHGVRGQKWGIRRYQYSDGSLTPAGRRRAQKLKGDYKALTGKKLKGKIPDEDPSKKSVKKLTDTELRDRITRLRAEKEAHALERDLSSNGSKFIRSVCRDVMAPAAINAGKTLLERFLINKGSELMGLNKKETKSAYEQLKEEVNMQNLKKQKILNDDFFNSRKTNDNTDNKNQNKNDSKNSNKKESPKSEPKERVVVGDIIINKTERKSNYDPYKNTVIREAVWEEKASSSNPYLLENKRKGQKLLGFYNG